MIVVGAKSAFPSRCMITCDAYGAESRNLNRKKRRGVILIQIHLKRLEMEKKRSGKDLCQGRLIIAVSQVTDHVFGILWISFNLRASPDWEFIQTWTLDANTRRILSTPLWHSHYCYLRLYVKVTTECLQSESLTCFCVWHPKCTFPYILRVLGNFEGYDLAV